MQNSGSQCVLISIIWEIVRNANSQAQPQAYSIRNSGVDAEPSVF